jgi:hypothetical protein
MAQDSIISGLFGLTPEMYQRSQAEEDQKAAMQFAQLSPLQQASAGFYSAGRGLGRGIGTLLGAEDPQLRMIAQQQQILKNVDPNDPESIAAGARMASEMGNPRLAAALSKQASDIALNRASIAQKLRERQAADPFNQLVSSGKYTPESLAAYRESGNLADLKLVEKPEKAETRSELQKLLDERAALDPVKDKQRYDAVQGRINILTTREPRASVSVTIPPQEKSEQSKRGEMLVKQYGDVSSAAGLAVKSLPSLEIQERILDEGFKTGFGAPAQKAAASVLASLGVQDAAKFATNAQTFYSASQAAVLQKQLEQKGPQTEADAQRITATGAQLGNTPEANKFIINVARAQLKRDIKQRNFWDDWWSKNKTYDGAENAWMTGEGAKSLFEYPELKSYAAKQQDTGAIGTWRVRR